MTEYGDYRLKSGDMAGKSYTELLDTEQGRDKLRFMSTLEPSQGSEIPLVNWFKGRKKWILESLAPYQDVSESEKPQTQSTESTVLDHEARISKLEQIAKQDVKALPPGQGWDDG